MPFHNGKLPENVFLITVCLNALLNSKAPPVQTCLIMLQTPVLTEVPKEIQRKVIFHFTKMSPNRLLLIPGQVLELIICTSLQTISLIRLNRKTVGEFQLCVGDHTLHNDRLTGIKVNNTVCIFLLLHRGLYKSIS